MGEKKITSLSQKKNNEKGKKASFPASRLDHTHLSDPTNSWTFYSFMEKEQKRMIWDKK